MAPAAAPSPPPALVGGVLTPRMHHRLLTCAETSADVARDSMPSFRSHQPLESYEVDEVFLIDHVPPACRRTVSKSFALGWQQCLEAVTLVLRAGSAPTPAAVAERLASSRGGFDAHCTQSFLGRGGRVEHAVAAVLWRSQEEHELLGDGSFAEVEEFKAANAALPAHPRDSDYEFARDGLLGEGFRAAPYRDDDREADSDGDSDDSSDASGSDGGGPEEEEEEEEEGRNSDDEA